MTQKLLGKVSSKTMTWDEFYEKCTGLKIPNSKKMPPSVKRYYLLKFAYELLTGRKAFEGCNY